MNIKFTTLIIASLLAGSFTASQPAHAGGGARFQFAPQSWAESGVRRSVQAAPPPTTSVRSGSVPKGSSFLGLNPEMLAKPTPQPQMKVAASPSFGQAAPQIAAPKSQFNSSFGQPGNPSAPPVVANLPPAVAPQAAQAKAMQPAKPAAPAQVMQPARKPVIAHNNLRSDKSVHATLASHPAKKTDSGLVAQAGKGITGYGPNVGYAPGPFLPGTYGDGMRSSADVRGQLLK